MLEINLSDTPTFSRIECVVNKQEQQQQRSSNSRQRNQPRQRFTAKMFSVVGSNGFMNFTVALMFIKKIFAYIYICMYVCVNQIVLPDVDHLNIVKLGFCSARELFTIQLPTQNEVATIGKSDSGSISSLTFIPSLLVVFNSILNLIWSSWHGC